MNAGQNVFCFLIRIYRWTISPAKTFLFGPLGGCRFSPSCSRYALEAIQAHGVSRGIWFGFKRICRCHPGSAGGHDPIPNPNSSLRNINTPLHGS